MNYNLFARAFALFLTIFISTPASAKLVTLELTGNVISGVAPGDTFFNIGSSIKYTVTFEETLATDTYTSIRSDKVNSYYFHSIKSFSGTVGSYDFSGDNGNIFIGNGLLPGRADSLSIRHWNSVYNEGKALGSIIRDDYTSTDGSLSGKPLSRVEIGAGNLGELLYSDSDLNENKFLAQQAKNPFSMGITMYFQDGVLDSFFGRQVNGVFTSMTITTVPIPTAFWLFGSSLLALVTNRIKRA